MPTFLKSLFEDHTRSTVALFLIFVTAYVALRYALVIAEGGQYWVTGDWLINYRSGFVRRGLAGTVTLALSDLTGLHSHVISGILQTAIYVTMMGLVLAVLLPVRLTGPVIMLAVSPVFLLMPFYYLKLAMSKEMVGFLAVAALAAWHPLGRRWIHWLGLAIFAAAGFVHEVNAFLAPAAIALVLLFASQGALTRREAAVSLTVIVLAASSALLLSALFKGHGLSAAICDDLMSRGESDRFCIAEGPVRWLERTVPESISFAWQEQVASGAWPKFLLGYLLAIVPFCLFRVEGDATGRRTALALAAAVAGIVLMSPLFVVASDWGRWISVYVFGLTLLTITALRFGLIAPRITSANPLFIIYGLAWSMPDFSGAGFTFGIFDKLSRLVGHLTAAFTG